MSSPNNRKTRVAIEGVTSFDIPTIHFTEREEIQNQYGDAYPQMANMEYSYSEIMEDDVDVKVHTFKQKDGTKN